MGCWRKNVRGGGGETKLYGGGVGFCLVVAMQECSAGRSEWAQLGLGVVRVRSIADDSLEGEGGA